MRNLKMKNSESGRSMIEMLGVLAIIGVLSVGGIAGYSKAMQKYRINKTIEQITLIAGNVRTFFAPQRSYTDLVVGIYGSMNSNLIRKAKLIPEEMWNTNGSFINVYGYGISIGPANKSYTGDKQAFYINYVLPLDEELCIGLASQDWSTAGVKGLYLGGAGGWWFAITIPTDMDNVIAKCSDAVSTVSRFGTEMQAYFYFDVNSNCWSEAKGNICS